MRRPFLLVPIIGMLAATSPLAASAAAQDCPALGREPEVSDHVVVSRDGETEIAITVMKPDVADCEDVPVVLHGHGWSGSRATAPDSQMNYGTPSIYLDAGYGFVSFDHRGHGESGDVAHTMQPEYELQDYPAILDWIHDELDWVLRDTDSGLDKDVVVAGYGASYGGGWQTMTSTIDGRLDALVPFITWYDLAHALAPQEVARSAWLALLEAAGEAFAEMDPQLHQWYAETLVTNRPPEDSREHFLRASPVSYQDQLQTPALLIQGVPDTLFPLEHAVGLYEAIRGNGVDAWLIGVNNGHILPGIQPTGVGGPGRDFQDGCTSDLFAHVLDFLDWQLWGDAAAGERFGEVPRVAIGTEQGDCVVADDWPAAAETIEVELGDVVVPQGAGTLLLPLLTPEEDTTLAGNPRLRADLPLELDDIVFASLVLETGDGMWVVDDQVTPLRTELGGSEGSIDLEMAGIATTVPAGATLHLRIEGVNEQFITNANRRPGALPLTSLVIELPHATQGTVAAFDTTRPEDAGSVGAPGAPAGDEGDGGAGSGGSLPATGGGLALGGLLALAVAARLRLRS